MPNELHLHGLASIKLHYHEESRYLRIVVKQYDYGMGKVIERDTDIYFYAGDNHTADLLMALERGAICEMADWENPPNEGDDDEPDLRQDDYDYRKEAHLNTPEYEHEDKLEKEHRRHVGYLANQLDDDVPF